MARLVYVGDPMCSWCWGFSPVVGVLEERTGLPVEVVVGGLRPGPAAREMDGEMKRFLAHHWEQVEERTGQPFRHDLFEEWEGWVYDTEPACRAVVTARDLDEDRALPLFTRVQEAFYVENRDVTTPGELRELAGEVGIDPDRFAERFESEEMRTGTWEDFRRARSAGVSGFPTLLLRHDGEQLVVTRGWAPLEEIVTALGEWRGRASA